MQLAPKSKGACPFCPVCDDKTPPEILSYRENGGRLSKARSTRWRWQTLPWTASKTCSVPFATGSVPTRCRAVRVPTTGWTSNRRERGSIEGGRPIQALRFQTDKFENLPAPPRAPWMRAGSHGMPSLPRGALGGNRAASPESVTVRIPSGVMRMVMSEGVWPDRAAFSAASRIWTALSTKRLTIPLSEPRAEV